MSTNAENYREMQSKWYENEASLWTLENRNWVVGSFDEHNNWKDYDDYLFRSVNDLSSKVALDFGCGPGRNIVKFANQFKRIDGVDIAKRNIENCKVYVEGSNIPFVPQLYQNTGADLSCIQGEEIYDVVFSTIAMQHICVYDTRFKIFSDMYRLLKKGGALCMQMGYGYSPAKRSVTYFENYTDANSTNGGCDVRIDDVKDLKDDLAKIGFYRFQYNIRPTGPGAHLCTILKYLTLHNKTSKMENFGACLYAVETLLRNASSRIREIKMFRPEENPTYDMLERCIVPINTKVLRWKNRAFVSHFSVNPLPYTTPRRCLWNVHVDMYFIPTAKYDWQTYDPECGEGVSIGMWKSYAESKGMVVMINVKWSSHLHSRFEHRETLCVYLTNQGQIQRFGLRVPKSDIIEKCTATGEPVLRPVFKPFLGLGY